MARRNPPPPPPRRSGPPSPKRVQTSLARVRQIAKSIPERDRPFDPSRAPTWRGSSRDLVVNGRTYEVRLVHKISPRDSDRKTVSLPESAFSDKNRLAAALRDAGIMGRGERLRSFRVEGDKVVAFPDRGIWHSFIIDMDSAGDYTPNGDIDPRDVPAHLRPAELRQEPEENGEDVGYYQSGRRLSESRDGWYQVEYATGSDYNGGSVNESNYRVLCEMLEEAHPDGSQPVVWARTSGGHGTYGVVVRYGDLDEGPREAIDALEDYPLMDEEDHSRLEMEQQDEAWENWAEDDFIKECAKHLGVDPYELKEQAEAAGVSWYAIFHQATEGANIYWEDQNGEGQWIDVKRAADKATDYIGGEKFPSYVSADMVDEYEKLGAVAERLQG